MDLATLLVRVDTRTYTTVEDYVGDVARIPAAMQKYITPAMQREDVEALRVVSAASALVDMAQALVCVCWCLFVCVFVLCYVHGFALDVHVGCT